MPEFFCNTTTIFWITAVVLVGISKAGFAGGVGVVATPLMALTIPVADAAALMLPILITVDIFNVYHYRHHFKKETLRLLIPAGLLGIVIGSIFFNYFADNERIMRVGIGIVAVAFVVYQAGRTALFGLLAKYRMPDNVGRILGVFAGFVSTLAHVGGPPIAIYLLPQRLDRRIYVGTVTLFFFTVNVVKLIPYSYLGLLRVGNISTILLLIPCAYIGVWLGYWLNHRFSEKWFLLIIYVLLFLTGIQLIMGDSLIALLAVCRRSQILQTKAFMVYWTLDKNT